MADVTSAALVKQLQATGAAAEAAKTAGDALEYPPELPPAVEPPPPTTEAEGASRPTNGR